MDNQNDLLKILGEIKNEIAGLHTKLDNQESRINILENQKLTAGLTGLDQPVIPTMPLPPIPPAPPAPPAPVAPAVSENDLSFGPQTSEIKPAPKSSDSLEERIGGRWFARIGVFITLCGVAFFLKYSFDNGWIGETGRVIIGILAGLGFLAVGEKTIRKYSLYGQIITGGGIGILYLSAYAAFDFYHLVSAMVAFLFMTLVTAIGLALSLRYDAKSIMIFSTLGGLLTPLLVSTGQNKQVELFSYVILLDLAVLAISFFRRWLSVNLIGLLGTWFLFAGWADKFYDEKQLTSTLIFATIFFLIYSLSSLANNLVKKVKSTGFEQALLVISSFFYFFSLYVMLIKDHRGALAVACILLSSFCLGGAYGVRKLTPEDDSLYNFLASLAITFVTVAIPVYFEKYLITSLWALEGTALFVMAVSMRRASSSENERKDGLVIQAFSMIALSLAVFRIIFVDGAFYGNGDWLFLNKVFVSSLLAIIGAYVCFVMLERETFAESDQKEAKALGTILLVVAAGLTVIAVNRDLDNFFQSRIRNEYARVEKINDESEKKLGKRIATADMVKANESYIDNNRSLNWFSVMLFNLFYCLGSLVLGFILRRKTFFYLSFFAEAWVLLMLSAEVADWHNPYRLMTVFSTLSALVFLSYWSHRSSKEEADFVAWKKILASVAIVANLFALFNFGHEISQYYQNSLKEARKVISNDCYLSLSTKDKASEVRDRENACSRARAEEGKIKNIQSVSISIFWIVYAIGLLAFGFWRRGKWFRLGGIALLAIAIFKLFLVDLWGFGALYRIISSITLGLSLLGISFAYQKYKHIFQEIIK